MKALVIARDPDTIGILSQVFQEKQISIQQCLPDSAAEQLFSEKFVAVVLDVDQLSRSVKVVESLLRVNKDIVMIAIASDAVSKAMASRPGRRLIIERPLRVERLRELLASSYGRMLRDSQVYFRLAIELPVSVRGANGKVLQCTTLNISQTGMAVSTPAAFSIGEEIQLAFALPNTVISDCYPSFSLKAVAHLCSHQAAATRVCQTS